MSRVAVIGSGIAGLGAAYALAGAARVAVFEAGSHFGGHAHTVDVTLDGLTHGVDTGFLVFNERTYQRLIKLFADLEVETAASGMSFSVQVPARGAEPGLEWSGSNLDTVFAQRGNLVRPRFWRRPAGMRWWRTRWTAVCMCAGTRQRRPHRTDRSCSSPNSWPRLANLGSAARC
jgi:predicted NAD/FAD-binding protein